MRAIVWTNYGAPDVLQLQDVEKPIPKDNEILIETVAATATMGDCEVRGLQFPLMLALPMRLFMGIRKPTRRTILGQEIAGDVVAVGKDVTRFNVGDAVFGSTGLAFGAYAEYTALPATDKAAITTIPANMTYDEAATVPLGGLESLHFLGLANIQRGQKVLINGAGGSIGTYGIQLAKHYGAEVTGVDSTPKLDMMRAIGADHVVDYTQEDFTRRGETYDVIFDIIGKSPFSRSINSLTANGVYLIGNPKLHHMIRAGWVNSRTSKRVVLQTNEQTPENLNHLKDLIEAGVLHAVIDRRYPLEETAEAHRYVGAGKKQGNVVITVTHSNN